MEDLIPSTLPLPCSFLVDPSTDGDPRRLEFKLRGEIMPAGVGQPRRGSSKEQKEQKAAANRFASKQPLLINHSMLIYYTKLCNSICIRPVCVIGNILNSVYH